MLIGHITSHISICDAAGCRGGLADQTAHREPTLPPRSKRLTQHIDPTDNDLVIRNVTVLGKRTSMRMEPQIWDALLEVTRRENMTVHHLCSLVAERTHRPASLTAAIRVFLLAYFRAAATEDGHMRASHGSRDLMAQLSSVFPDRDGKPDGPVN